MEYEICYRNLKDKSTFIAGLEAMDSLILLLVVVAVMWTIRSGFLQLVIIGATWQGLVFFKKGKPPNFFHHMAEFKRKRKAYPAKETRGDHFK